jgi:hypothetical protein
MGRVKIGPLTFADSDGNTPGAEVDRIPPGAELPVRTETDQTGQFGCAVVMFFLALLVVGVGVWQALSWGPIGLVVLLILSLVGLLLAVLGLAIKVYEETYEFTPEHVARYWRTLLGRKQWREPYSNYLGVLMREKHHSGGQNSSSYTEHIARLKHRSDESKDVVLYTSREHEGFRTATERYCRLLDLPALRQREDGTLEERAVEDLDKSVRDMVAEGRMDVTFDPTRPPPGDVLKLTIEGQGLRISALGNTLRKLRRVVVITTLVTGVILAASGAFLEHLHGAVRVLLVVAGVADVAVGQVLAYLARQVGQELYVSPTEVSSWWVLPWGEFARRTVSAGQVEDVSVRTPPNSQGFTAVVAETDESHVVFGVGMTDAEKRWIRNCIIAVISKDAGPVQSGPPAEPE